MEIEVRSAKVKTAGGEMPVHVARPKGVSEKLPAVLVIMEAFGLNGHIRDVTNRFAREGYHAVAPDVYHRFGSPVVGYGELPRAIELLRSLRDEDVVADLRALVSNLKADPEVRGDRIGITGFCMGGRIAYLAACEIPELRAAVPWYGGAIAGPQMVEGATPPVEKTRSTKAAWLLHFAENDSYIPPEVVEEVRKALEREGEEFELYVYPGAEHGFFCDERSSYHPEAASLAWERTLRFFARHLKG
jgi:carboxymethylenebutenolidase